MADTNKQAVQCPLHLPPLAWGAAGLETATSLGWKRLLLLSVQEHVALRTQVAGGSITLCVCVPTALNACSVQSLDDIYGPY